MSTYSPTIDPHTTLFTKTPRGRAEMVERSAGLKSRQRTVLIMLDGQRLARDIAILSADEIAEAIQHLLALDLIEPLADTAPVPTPQPVQAVPELEPVDSTLADIKALMTDSANTYLGLMAADLVRRVHKARDEPELLSVVGHWHMAMRESKYGRDVAESHLARIKSRFGGDALGAAVH